MHTDEKITSNESEIKIMAHIELETPKRAIFICKRCKHLERKFTYIREYTGKSEYSDSYFRFNENNKIVWQSEEYFCEACKTNAWVSCNLVNGVLNEKHKCNAKCMGATTGVCSCSCGGKNHGVSHG